MASILDIQFSPTAGYMTFFAHAAERTAMSVFRAMTIVAVDRQLQVDRVFRLVARLACDFLVRAGQRIFCLRRMVEAPPSPAIRIVARRTLRTETSLMFVLVTFFTRERRLFILRRLMTVLARHRSMQPDQRKAREIVIETCLLPPIVFIVAPLTSRTELVLVRILALVTGDASRL